MEIIDIDLSELLEDPSNVNKHPEKNMNALKGSLKKFGQQKPIVINSNNIIVAGNGTYQAAKALKWETLKCVRSDLDNVNQIAYAIADNRTSELSEWDDVALKEQLRSLTEADFDIGDIGFEDFKFDDKSDQQVTPEEAAKLEEGIEKANELSIDNEYLIIMFDDTESFTEFNKKISNDYKVCYWITKAKKNATHFRTGPNRVLSGNDFLEKLNERK